MGYNNIMYYYAIMRFCAVSPENDGIFQDANAFSSLTVYRKYARL